MKNIVLSAVAVLAMSSFAVAGGGFTTEQEEMVVFEEPNLSPLNNFYLGFAYSFVNAERTALLDDQEFSGLMLQMGYNINEYVAIEGRYWFGNDETMSSNLEQSIDSWGIYVKPQYPVTEALNVYGLLGYASSEYIETFGPLTYTSDADIDGFSWGLGASFAFSKNISIFVDYVNLYDDTNTYRTNTSPSIDVNIEDSIDTVNLGITYNF